MTGRDRCDEIIRLIDEALGVSTTAPLPVLEPVRVGTRRPSRTEVGR